MALFRRNRGDADELLADDLETPEPVAAVPPASGEDGGVVHFELAPGGPWDETEAPADELPRLDLGALRVPIVEGIELSIEANEQDGSVTGVSYTIPEVGMMQISVFAAPRTAGIWEEVRDEIVASAAESGGRLAPAAGPHGPELRGHVPTDQPGQLAPARFVGVDGPRWFARAVISGQPAENDEMGEALLGLFRMCVIVRGDEALPVRELLPMRVPREVLDAAEQVHHQGHAADQPATSEDFKPFERGPEITEIH